MSGLDSVGLRNWSTYTVQIIIQTWMGDILCVGECVYVGVQMMNDRICIHMCSHIE